MVGRAANHVAGNPDLHQGLRLVTEDLNHLADGNRPFGIVLIGGFDTPARRELLDRHRRAVAQREQHARRETAATLRHVRHRLDLRAAVGHCEAKIFNRRAAAVRDRDVPADQRTGSGRVRAGGDAFGGFVRDGRRYRHGDDIRDSIEPKDRVRVRNRLRCDAARRTGMLPLAKAVCAGLLAGPVVPA